MDGSHFMDAIARHTQEHEAVMRAITSEDTNRLMELLERHRDVIDVHKICNDGTTIACAAARTGNIKNLRAVLGDIDLYEKQISPKRIRTSGSKHPKRVTRRNREPKHPACLYRGNLDAGVSQAYRFTCFTHNTISQFDNFGKNPLHYAVSKNHSEIVEWLLRYSDLHCNQADRSSKSPLHLAVEAENEEMVKQLLEKGAAVDSKDNEGKTPLHNATERGFIKIMNILLDAGSDINALDLEGSSNLILASLYNRLEALELLLKRGAGVNYEDDHGFTALKRAIYRNNAKATRILIQHGARICESENFLHHAAVSNLIAIAYCLIEGGARLEAKDHQGNTPLMTAIQYKRFELAKFFLAKGANPNTTNSHSGTTSLHISMNYIHEPALIEKFIDLLLEHGANVYTRCNFGYDALYYAFMHKNDAGACHLIKIMDVNFKHEAVRLDYLSSCMTHSKGPEPIEWLMLAGFNLKNFVNKSVDPIKPEQMNVKQKYLHDFLCQTLSLQDLCRIQVRRNVKPDFISKLPLPTTVQNYLLFK